MKNPRNIPIPPDPQYDGKHDYQGNHDVFEMPENLKPSDRSIPKMPLGRIAGVVIAIGILLLLLLVGASILQQSSLLGP